MDWLIILISNYLIFLAVMFLPYLYLHGHKKLSLQCAFAALIAWGFSTFIKDFFYIPRPYIVEKEITVLGIWLDGSFPSGHAALLSAIAFLVLTKKTSWGIFFFGICLLTSLGRIVGGVHSLVDIIGGLVIGFISAFLTKKIPFSYPKKAFRG